MDDLQYSILPSISVPVLTWVLNLVINGWPSILNKNEFWDNLYECFKTCYKWMTFNTGFKQYAESQGIKF